MPNPKEFQFNLPDNNKPSGVILQEEWFPGVQNYWPKCTSQRSTGDHITGVVAIVIHATDGASSAGAVSVMNPPPGEQAASFHWLVPDEDEPQHGKLVWACVRERDAAWHVRNTKFHSDVNDGKTRVNHWSLGIEVVNRQSGGDSFSDWQVAATAQIVRYCREKYPNLRYIVSHAKLDPERRNDPGPNFPWEKFKELVLGAQDPLATLTIAAFNTEISNSLDQFKTADSLAEEANYNLPESDSIENLHSSKRSKTPFNGLHYFSFAAETSPALAFTMNNEEIVPASLDAETAARTYLATMMNDDTQPQNFSAEANTTNKQLKLVGIESVPLTNTQTVKFREYINKIPVYGSLYTVEMSKNNEYINILAGTTPPIDLDPVAKISPYVALNMVKERAGYLTEPLNAVPRLHYYYNTQEGPNKGWRLVYIIEEVLVKSRAEGQKNIEPVLMDYVIDAHEGNFITEIPRSHFIEGEFIDGLGNIKRISFSETPDAVKRLIDETHNVHTHDFQFQSFQLGELPGAYPNNPPVWDGAAISAHANAVTVAKFFKEVLKRNGLDNKGGPLISSINCVENLNGSKEWKNAAWLSSKRQMIYGQRMSEEGKLISYAVSLDVVAHEILHGLTNNTAKLANIGEPGALNESYSDIFGVIISNIHKADINNWNWEMGEDLSNTGRPIRDLKDPHKFGIILNGEFIPQPEHMDDYKLLPQDRFNDFGGVHLNNGIHNKAAYNLLTSKKADGQFLFDGNTVAALFYLALTQFLASTSGFSQSRLGVELSAKSLFRDDVDREEKIAAVSNAFALVGITLPV